MLRSLLHSILESTPLINLYNLGQSVNNTGHLVYLTVDFDTLKPHLKPLAIQKITKIEKKQVSIPLFQVFRNKSTAQKAVSDIISVLSPLKLQYSVHHEELPQGKDLTLVLQTNLGHLDSILMYHMLFTHLTPDALSLLATAQDSPPGSVVGDYLASTRILIVIDNKFYPLHALYSNLSAQYQQNLHKFLKLIRIANYKILTYISYSSQFDANDFNLFVQRRLPGSTQTSADLSDENMNNLFDIFERQAPCLLYNPAMLHLNNSPASFAYCTPGNGITYLMGPYHKDSPAEASAKVLFPELLKILGFSPTTPITWSFDINLHKQMDKLYPPHLSRPWELMHQLTASEV